MHTVQRLRRRGLRCRRSVARLARHHVDIEPAPSKAAAQRSGQLTGRGQVPGQQPVQPVVVVGIDRFEARGGSAARDISEAAADADVLITMLPAGAHVRDVYLEEAGILASVKSAPLLIDCSTIDVETARHVAGKASDAGLLMLDAPVSGGVMGAEAATQTIMVG